MLPSENRVKQRSNFWYFWTSHLGTWDTGLVWRTPCLLHLFSHSHSWGVALTQLFPWWVDQSYWAWQVSVPDDIPVVSVKGVEFSAGGDWEFQHWKQSGNYYPPTALLKVYVEGSAQDTPKGSWSTWQWHFTAVMDHWSTTPYLCHPPNLNFSL